MGTPLFGKNVLEKLIEEFDVVLVITQPDKRGKRGSDLIESPVKILAKQKNISIFQPVSIKEDYSEMTNYNFDFLVTAAYGQFIPLDVLHLPKVMTLNVHGSLLPLYRGGAPIQRAIEAGDEYLGVSTMRTILKMDAGVVFKQSKVKLEETDNTLTMMDKLSKVGAVDLVEVIEKLYDDSSSIEVMHQDVSKVTFASNITKEEELLDFNLDARKVFNKIRAFYPNPLTYFNFDGDVYKVYESEVVSDNSISIPGTILDNKNELVIKCKENAIKIKTIQQAGKNVMNIKEFLNGKRNKFLIGCVIE